MPAGPLRKSSIGLPSSIRHMAVSSIWRPILAAMTGRVFQLKFVNVPVVVALNFYAFSRSDEIHLALLFMQFVNAVSDAENSFQNILFS